MRIHLRLMLIGTPVMSVKKRKPEVRTQLAVWGKKSLGGAPMLAFRHFSLHRNDSGLDALEK